jgi:dTDP-4-amino-4,6-dideoxygalactose transaminase
MAGTIGNAGCFSFYPGKNLGAFGEAGAIITNDPDLQERIRTLRDHGQVRKYHHAAIGWNCRMDGIQAAVLSVKLQHLDNWNSLRRLHAAEYQSSLKDIDEVVRPFVAPYAEHVYHIYAIRVEDRDEALWRLNGKGIQCGIHYPVPVHLQKAYQSLGHARGSFPVSERIARELISLPMFPELTQAQIDMVIFALKEATLAGVFA